MDKKNINRDFFYKKDDLSETEIVNLFKKSSAGDLLSREKLIVHYMYLLGIHISQYMDQGVSYDDLFQEACFGLIEAVDKYNPSRGANFNTFSTFYIKKYLKKALITQNIQRPIIYKEDFFYEAQRFLRTFDELSEKKGRAPSDEELSKALHITVSRIKTISHRLFSFLSRESFEEGDRGSLFIDKTELSAEEAALLKASCLDLSHLGIELSDREEEILCRRFGFTSSGEPESIAEISAKMGLSYETIRGTYAKTITRIQNAAKAHGYCIK